MGYVQWVEFDFTALLEGNGTVHLAFRELLRPIIEYKEENKLSLCPAQEIQAAGKKCGLVDVKRHSVSSLEHPDWQEESQAWLVKGIRGLLQGVFLRTNNGYTIEHAKQRTNESICALLDLFKQGLRPNISFSTVVGRLPE